MRNLTNPPLDLPGLHEASFYPNGSSQIGKIDLRISEPPDCACFATLQSKFETRAENDTHPSRGRKTNLQTGSPASYCLCLWLVELGKYVGRHTSYVDSDQLLVATMI
jgi:hypothetical protein